MYRLRRTVRNRHSSQCRAVNIFGDREARRAVARMCGRKLAEFPDDDHDQAEWAQVASATRL